MVFWILHSACLLILFSFLQACDVFTAQSGVVDSFDSHDAYQNASYSHNTLVCWIIQAEEGYAIAGWTADDFHLETGYDGLHIFCGHDGEEGYIGSYTGEIGISSSFPIYTVDEEMYLVLYTDWSVAENGFRFFFTAVNETEAGDGDCGEYPEDEDDDDDDEKHVHRYSGGAVAGIVFGVLLLLAFLGIVAACVVCFVCSIKTRPKRIVSNYPMGYPGMTPVGATQSGMPSEGGVPQPPAYSGASGPFSSPPNQQLYGNEQKVHPDHIAPNGTFSPPPNYEPQTTAHY